MDVEMWAWFVAIAVIGVALAVDDVVHVPVWLTLVVTVAILTAAIAASLRSGGGALSAGTGPTTAGTRHPRAG